MDSCSEPLVRLFVCHETESIRFSCFGSPVVSFARARDLRHCVRVCVPAWAWLTRHNPANCNNSSLALPKRLASHEACTERTESPRRAASSSALCFCLFRCHSLLMTWRRRIMDATANPLARLASQRARAKPQRWTMDVEVLGSQCCFWELCGFH